MYQTDATLTARVQEYLIYLAPIILLGGQRFFYTGLLIQARLTGWVTVLNLLFLGVEIIGLVIGFTLGYPPVLVLVGSESLAILVQIAATMWVRQRYYVLPVEVLPVEASTAEASTAGSKAADLSYRELTAFFIPVSMTGVMFALSRPVLYAFVSRTPSGLLAIAALRVAFDFSMIFQQAANQFRHFFVTFGIDDLAGKRRFMTQIGLGITAIMLLFAVTPLSDLVWRDLMKIPDNVRALSVQTFLIMCLMPTVIIIRNYYHGLLMVARRTSGMALGSILRVVAIYFGAQLCYSFGWLNHITASIILILGFVIETLVVLQVAKKGQGVRENATAKM
jgi:hypothetical protein